MIESYRTIKRKVVLEYLEKYQETPSLTLARILKRDHSALFKDVEEARTSIRIYRGQHGSNHREKVKVTKYYKDVPMA